MCFSTFANVLFLTAWGFRGGTFEPCQELQLRSSVEFAVEIWNRIRGVWDWLDFRIRFCKDVDCGVWIRFCGISEVAAFATVCCFTFSLSLTQARNAHQNFSPKKIWTPQVFPSKLFSPKFYASWKNFFKHNKHKNHASLKMDFALSKPSNLAIYGLD